jgi:hypothetical protein
MPAAGTTTASVTTAAAKPTTGCGKIRSGNTVSLNLVHRAKVAGFRCSGVAVPSTSSMGGRIVGAGHTAANTESVRRRRLG